MMEKTIILAYYEGAKVLIFDGRKIPINDADCFGVNTDGETVWISLNNKMYTIWFTWLDKEGNSTSFFGLTDNRDKDGYALLGNGKGKVKPWYLPFDWVFCVVDVGGYQKIRIVKNSVVPNIYALPVKVVDGVVVGLWEYKPPGSAFPIEISK